LKIYYDDKLICSNIILADSFYKKLRGLMFYKDFEKKGMCFKNTNWIHSFFMNFAIDVLYLDSDFNVISIKKNLKPWSLSFPRFKAKHLIEFKANSVLDISCLYEHRRFKCLDFCV